MGVVDGEKKNSDKLNKVLHISFIVLSLIGGVILIAFDSMVSSVYVGVVLIMYSLGLYLLYKARNDYYELMEKYNETDLKLHGYKMELMTINANKELEKTKDDLSEVNDTYNKIIKDDKN